MGFNPCNGFQCDMSALGEAVFRQLADAIASNGMRAAGYTWLLLDDGWAASSRLPNGSLAANAAAFPSGIASLVSYAKTRGLDVGLYTCRGTTTCEGLPGSPGAVSVLLQSATAAGTLLAAVNYPGGYGPMGVAIADMNGDGKPDLVIADGDIVVRLNSPTAPGTFGPPNFFYN